MEWRECRKRQLEATVWELSSSILVPPCILITFVHCPNFPLIQNNDWRDFGEEEFS